MRFPGTRYVGQIERKFRRIRDFFKKRVTVIVGLIITSTVHREVEKLTKIRQNFSKLQKFFRGSEKTILTQITFHPS